MEYHLFGEQRRKERCSRQKKQKNIRHRQRCKKADVLGTLAEGRRGGLKRGNAGGSQAKGFERLEMEVS